VFAWIIHAKSNHVQKLLDDGRQDIKQEQGFRFRKKRTLRQVEVRIKLQVCIYTVDVNEIVHPNSDGGFRLTPLLNNTQIQIC
jgi:hypothetical protein